MLKQPRKWAILMGMYAQILFVLSWLAFGLVQGERYSWVQHSISDMYATSAPHGTLLVALLTICGALTILYIIFGLYPTIKKIGISAKLGSVLLVLSIYGVGDLLSPFERLGCRMADAGCSANAQLATAGGRMDQLLSTVGIILFMIGIITTGYAMRQIKNWHKVSMVIIIGGYLFIPLFFLQGAGNVEIGGVVERLIALLGAMLLLITADLCYRKLD